MALNSKKIKSIYRRQRDDSRKYFYNSPIHKQTISDNIKLFCNHLNADFEFAIYAPFYNPMDEFNLLPFISFLFEQIVTWLELFYLAFVYSTLSLFFSCLFPFNLTDSYNTLYILTNASACLLLVSLDIAVNIGLLAISPISRFLATFFPADIPTTPLFTY